MSISDGYAPVPEQSTLALVAHHPQAFYFGMKQGKLKPVDATAPDDVIKGSKRDPSLFAQADAEELDVDPVEGGVAEGEGDAVAGAPLRRSVAFGGVSAAASRSTICSRGAPWPTWPRRCRSTRRCSGARADLEPHDGERCWRLSDVVLGRCRG